MPPTQKNSQQLQSKDNIPGIFLWIWRRVPCGNDVSAKCDGRWIPGMWIRFSVTHQSALSTRQTQQYDIMFAPTLVLLRLLFFKLETQKARKDRCPNKLTNAA